jgi:hypothetical protein
MPLLRFGNAGWASGLKLSEIRHLKVLVDLLALARGRWVFHDLLVCGAAFHLERDPSGKAN